MLTMPGVSIRRYKNIPFPKILFHKNQHFMPFSQQQIYFGICEESGSASKKTQTNKTFTIQKSA